MILYMAMINRIRLYMGTGLVRGLYNNLETENNINYSYQMVFCESVDRKQLVNLLTGMLGIYTLYFIAGILHESLYNIYNLEQSGHIIIE